MLDIVTAVCVRIVIPLFMKHIVLVWTCGVVFICSVCTCVYQLLADIYDWNAIFKEAWSAEVNICTEVLNRVYGPTYCSTYNILYGEYATGEPFWVPRLKSFQNKAIFALKSISLIWDSCVMLNFPMVVQSPYYMCFKDISILCLFHGYIYVYELIKAYGYGSATGTGMGVLRLHVKAGTRG